MLQIQATHLLSLFKECENLFRQGLLDYLDRLPQLSQKDFFNGIKRQFEGLNILNFVQTQLALRYLSSCVTSAKSHGLEESDRLSILRGGFLRYGSKEKPDLEDIPFSSIVQSAMGILSPNQSKFAKVRIDLAQDFKVHTNVFSEAHRENFENEFPQRLEEIKNDLVSLYWSRNEAFIAKHLAKSYMTEIISICHNKDYNPIPPELLKYHINQAAHWIKLGQEGYLEAFYSTQEILDFFMSLKTLLMIALLY